MAATRSSTCSATRSTALRTFFEQLRGLRVSAHFSCAETAGAAVSSTARRAWHAGVSHWGAATTATTGRWASSSKAWKACASSRRSTGRCADCCVRRQRPPDRGDRRARARGPVRKRDPAPASSGRAPEAAFRRGSWRGHAHVAGPDDAFDWLIRRGPQAFRRCRSAPQAVPGAFSHGHAPGATTRSPGGRAGDSRTPGLPTGEPLSDTTSGVL